MSSQVWHGHRKKVLLVVDLPWINEAAKSIDRLLSPHKIRGAGTAHALLSVNSIEDDERVYSFNPDFQGGFTLSDAFLYYEDRFRHGGKFLDFIDLFIDAEFQAVPLSMNNQFMKMSDEDFAEMVLADHCESLLNGKYFGVAVYGRDALITALAETGVNIYAITDSSNSEEVRQRYGTTDFAETPLFVSVNRSRRTGTDG